MEKKKGFTLIELIAVLVIIAIIALIVVSIVMSVIKKVKESSRRRSIDAYGRSVELAVSSYLLDRGSLPSNLKTLNVEYSGAKVECNIMMIKENGSVYLSECKVNNVEVLDNSTRDGWYHYNTKDYTDKEYIDIYGEELQEASINYYRAYGSIVKDYKKLSIKNIGKKVQCDVRINYDGSVYLTDCSVGKNKIKDETEDGYYHYGSFKYGVGDKITYKNNDYYVIKNSDENSQEITMIKAEMLTGNEISRYGQGHINNNVNIGSGSPYCSNYNSPCGVQWYSGYHCGYNPYNNPRWQNDACRTDYEYSEIKYIVDGWGEYQVDENDMVADTTGYSVRLLTKEEYNYLENEINSNGNDSISEWLYPESSISYWTMSVCNASNKQVCIVNKDSMSASYVYAFAYIAVRPVITIKKSAIN